MTEPNPTKQASSDCDPTFTAGSVTLVLDAPTQPIANQPLPAQFRTMPNSPTISGVAASGSAEFSQLQFQAMLAKIEQSTQGFPLVVVDLRQEPHGILTLEQPLNGENEIAVGWFAERDWLNVGKGLPSILVDEDSRLASAAQTGYLIVCAVTSKAKTEDGICTATPDTVHPTSYKTEQTLVQAFPNVSYLRLPTTDHCRPRDSEVDQFVAFEASLDPKTWLHFHCRAGDGRTTSFMAMHDIIHNAPGDSLSTILTRQKDINGIDLASLPTDQTIFSYPFSVERVLFIQSFYAYVCEAKPEGFKVPWSEWVSQQIGQNQVAASA